MNKNLFVIILCLFVGLFLVACDSEAVQTIEVTRIVPQTVVATQIVEVTIEIPQSTPMNEAADQLCMCIQDAAYYNGIVAISQFYTLLGQGLYEEAYQLLSPSQPRYPSLEEFKENGEVVQITAMEVVSIEPEYERAQKLGYDTCKDSADKLVFFARIYKEAESGQVNNGTQSLFITVVLENGKWKIYAINTSPPA